MATKSRLKWNLTVLAVAAVFPTANFRAAQSTRGSSAGAMPASKQFAATLPNGRRIAPAGDWITVAPFPFSLAVRADGEQLAVPSIGFPFALNVIDRPLSPDRKATQVPPGFRNSPDVEVYTGVAYSPDGKLLYVATGETGAVDILAADTWKTAGCIDLNGALEDHTYKETFAAALVISADGQRLYVIDEANWRVAAVDTTTKTVVGSLPTGVNPIALCLSPDGKRLHIVNSGLFEYKTVPGADNDDRLHTGLHFPPFGYPSREARTGTVVEGRDIPGLGEENDPRGSSLWTYDLGSLDAGHFNQARPAALLRLGAPILSSKGHVVGGAAPSAVVAGANAVYVALAHQDSVAVISADGARLKAEIPLSPFSGAEYRDHQGHSLRGVMPSGLALSGGRLYVTEAGIDALAVIDLAS